MANEEHLAILQQGVEVWNAWRAENPNIMLDLSVANLSEADLSETDLGATDLSEATDLTMANLTGANLTGANLTMANLSGANLSGANLTGANLSGAFLAWADLTGANLAKANLSGAFLLKAVLTKAVLEKSTLSETSFEGTILADIDLSTVEGLETVDHRSPSYIDILTLYRSQGKIPDVFLRGCGVPEDFITFLPSLIGKPIDFYSCFISYSHADKAFARRLHDRLQGEGIRCWLDEHQLNPGDPLHPTIYEAIRVYDKIILCCSETALKSWWVEKEFNRTIKKEEDYRLPLLIPLTLDGYLFEKTCDGWIADEIKQRLVQDMRGWKDHDAFETALKGVIKALRTDGGKEPPPEPKLKRA